MVLTGFLISVLLGVFISTSYAGPPYHSSVRAKGQSITSAPSTGESKVLRSVRRTESRQPLVLSGQKFQVREGELVNVRIMGQNEINDESAYLDPEQQNKYLNIGKIECRISGYETIKATGWIAASNDTLSTVAHAFYHTETKLRINPSSCTFAIYGTRGQELDRIDILYARSGWDDPEKFRDRSFDIAIVKLARRPRYRIAGPKLAIAKDLDARPVTFISFHGGSADLHYNIVRQTHGMLIKMPADANPTADDSLYFVSDFTRLFQVGYDSLKGSSGGMIVDDVTGMVLGVHVGSNEAHIEGDFDTQDNYNYGIYFDRKYIEMLKAVAADKGL